MPPFLKDTQNGQNPLPQERIKEEIDPELAEYLLDLDLEEGSETYGQKKKMPQ